MTPEQFEEIFEKVKKEPALASHLRKLILHLAMSGKLTSAAAGDGKIDEVVAEIEDTRQKLIKSKSIKNNKVVLGDLPDNLPEIPSHWAWSRLGMIGDWGSGSTPKRGETAYYGGDYIWLKSGELKDNKNLTDSEEKVTAKAIAECSFRVNQPGDVLIAMYGATIGSIGIVEKEAVTNQAVCGCSPFKGIDNYFLFYFLASYRDNFTASSVGGAQPNISKEKIVATYFPLPPLEEQKRIVAKVDELMALCDELENAGHKRNLAKTNFNSSSNSHLCGGRAIQAETLKRSFELQVGNIEDLEKIRKTVFTLAIQGKLTTQSSSDEPALELLNRIDVEKAKDESSASRARKKDGNDYGFLKYEIPSNWAWTSLAQIGHISPKTEGDEAQQASFVEMASIFAEYGKSHLTETRIWAKIKKGYTRFREGDVGLAKITPCFENGKSAVFDSLVNGIGAGTTELLVVRPYLVETRYILTFLKSEFFIGNGIPLMTGTAGQKRVPSGYFANCPFPLPPLEEQKRIVGKVDELMALCDDLGASLSKEEAIKANLLKTLVA